MALCKLSLQMSPIYVITDLNEEWVLYLTHKPPALYVKMISRKIIPDWSLLLPQYQSTRHMALSGLS